MLLVTWHLWITPQKGWQTRPLATPVWDISVCTYSAWVQSCWANSMSPPRRTTKAVRYLYGWLRFPCSITGNSLVISPKDWHVWLKTSFIAVVSTVKFAGSGRTAQLRYSSENWNFKLTETEITLFWRHFYDLLLRKLSKWQFLMQPVTKILLKLHLRRSVDWQNRKYA